MNKNHRSRISLELEPELKKKIEAHAKAVDLTLSQTVRKALRYFLRRVPQRPSPA
jgi:predicted transcriptional regulator